MFFKKEKNKEEKPKEKTRRIYINIDFYDGKFKGFHEDHPVNSKISYVKCYYDFYKWFFYRKDSDVYSFRFNKGAEIFYRKDIKSVSFFERVENK